MIERRFQGRVKTVGSEIVDFPTGVTLFYDPDFDQIAVSMIFAVEGEADVAWTVGRDLLRNGSQSSFPVGDGDVRLCAKAHMEVVILCLNPPHGHCDVHLPVNEVRAFLDDVYECLPESSEDFSSEVDEAIKELLS